VAFGCSLFVAKAKAKAKAEAKTKTKMRGFFAALRMTGVF
jgi:hypothetical protein